MTPGEYLKLADKWCAGAEFWGEAAIDTRLYCIRLWLDSLPVGVVGGIGDFARMWVFAGDVAYAVHNEHPTVFEYGITLFESIFSWMANMGPHAKWVSRAQAATAYIQAMRCTDPVSVCCTDPVPSSPNPFVRPWNEYAADICRTLGLVR